MSVTVIEEDSADLNDDTAPFTLQDWISAPFESFDNSEVYEQHIKPLIHQLEALCHEHRVPFYYRATISADRKGSTARTTLFLGGVGRATPELLAAAKLDEFSMDYVGSMLGLVGACKKKFSRHRAEGAIDVEEVDNGEG